MLSVTDPTRLAAALARDASRAFVPKASLQKLAVHCPRVAHSARCLRRRPHGASRPPGVLCHLSAPPVLALVFVLPGVSAVKILCLRLFRTACTICAKSKAKMLA